MTTGVAPAGVDPGRAVRRTRAVLLWALAVVLGGALLALVAGGEPPEEYLHPDGTGQGGARAVVEVLGDHGIDVEVVTTSTAAVDATRDGDTLVVGNSDLLTDTAFERLLRGTRSADRVVLLDAAPGVLRSVDLGVVASAADGDSDRRDCSLPGGHGGGRVARISRAITASGDALPSGARGCWPTTSGRGGEPPAYAAVDLPATGDHAPVTVVGFPDAATNRFVTEGDNAALVLRLLGGSSHLVWFHPGPQDATANPARDAPSVWPGWTAPGLVVVALAFVAFAVARGRRLGRLVPEPLPVVVRAAETTESRAELYRAAADRWRAARVLRSATTGRLATRLGLPAGATAEQVAPVAADAAGLPSTEVDRLLRGPAPADEHGLVDLAQQLAHLEEKVRSS